MAKCKLVAEIGINHNGDGDMVGKMIKLAKDSGFDMVKFQKRNCDIIVPEDKKNQMKETPWGNIKYIDYKKKLELSQRDYESIDIYCTAVGIDWFASPWDIDSARFLKQFDTEYIKIASACLTDIELLKEIKKDNKKIIISTGMSSKEEFDIAMEIVGDRVEYILACTSTYPTVPEEMNLRFITRLKAEYRKYKIGFSSHSPGIFLPATTILYDTEMIEVHITLDRAMFGSDQAASIEPAGMRKLVKYVRDLEKAKGNGNWTVFSSEEPVKFNLRRF
jgi:N-acetylneuraminate synthase